MSDSDSDAELKSKKKAAKDKKRKSRADSSSDDEVVDRNPPKKAKGDQGDSSSSRVKNGDGEEMIEIGKMKFVNVRDFKGKTYVDIREYYLDKGSGTLKPGKKGISMSVEQYQNFKNIIGDIDSLVKGKS